MGLGVVLAVVFIALAATMPPVGLFALAVVATGVAVWYIVALTRKPKP
jgi:hypothetical protein